MRPTRREEGDGAEIAAGCFQRRSASRPVGDREAVDTGRCAFGESQRKEVKHWDVLGQAVSWEERDRETDRQTDRQTDRHRQTDRQRGGGEGEIGGERPVERRKRKNYREQRADRMEKDWVL